MRNFFLIKHYPRGLTEVYQENSRQKRNLPDTRTIVQSLSNVKCRVVFWFFPLRRWHLSFNYAAHSRLVLSQDDFFCSPGQPKKPSHLGAAAKIVCDKMNLTMH